MPTSSLTHSCHTGNRACGRCRGCEKHQTAFTRTALAKPFTVWTKWVDARGASKLHRFYAVIVTDRGSLSSLLVQNGLARVYGVPMALPDRMKPSTYIERLKGYEAKAKAEKRGGWK